MPIPEGVLDPRVRSYVSPARVVWSTPHGVTDPRNLLSPDDSVCVLSPTGSDEPPAVLLDYGCELHGAVRIEVPTTSTGRHAKVRIRFGESVTEAMSEPNQDHTIHDLEVSVPWMGHQEYGNTGFRFVRVDLLDRETAIHVRYAPAVHLRRDAPYLGAFECDDERLNEIWRVGAHTVHLCMQDLVWDGIKRDRLPWIGDLHPEAMVISNVFGEQSVVCDTLDYVRDHTPLPHWMNGISSYSLWWIRCHFDWYRHHGNLEYLAEQRGYLLGLLAQLRDCVGPDGREHLDGHRFLEWPTSRDETAIDCGLQSLVLLALQAGADLCAALDETEAERLTREVVGRAAACAPPESPSKQANALAVLAGTADAVAMNRDLLSVDPYRGLSTFYGYYVLEARAMAGDHAGCLDLIRNYWGGMLDMGATTFWEGFEIDWMENSGRIDAILPAGKRDIHADFGDYCYKGLRHSLCHGWAAGPTAWLQEHVLGIAPTAPGFARVRVKPNLAGLRHAKGAVPTPAGLIEVTHELREDGGIGTRIVLPEGVQAEEN